MIEAGPSTAPSVALGAVLELLRSDGRRLFGAQDVLIEPERIEIRESSEVARTRVTTSAAVRYVFAKVLKPRRPGASGAAEARQRLRHDFDVTRHVFDALRSTPDLRAVEPVACYEHLLGMVTQEAPGVPLDLFITRGARWPVSGTRLAELETALARAGRWIAAFQRVAPDPASSRMSLDATREYLDVRLQRLVGLRRASFHEDDRRDLLAYFDRRAAAVPTADLVDVAVHGDITPSNIVVAPDGVTVIDFAMTARGSKYLDVARLYTQLAFYTAKPQYRPAVISRLQRAALAGFDPDLSPDNPLFELCAIQHVVCHLLSHARQPGRFPRSVYSRHQCRLHRRWLRQKSRRGPHDRTSSRQETGAFG